MENPGNHIASGHVRAKTTGRIRKPQKTFSCDPCRISRLQCDRKIPCAKCIRRSIEATSTYRSTRRDAPSDTTTGERVPGPSRPTIAERLGQHPFTPTLPPQDNPDEEINEPTVHNCETLLQRPEHPIQAHAIS